MAHTPAPARPTPAPVEPRAALAAPSVALGSLPPRAVRLSGTADTPRWRGRIHLWACLAAVPAGTALVLAHPSPSVDIYVATLVLLYGTSAGYHLLPLSAPWRRRLRQADHAMIYVFTAASVTAFCHLAVHGLVGTTVAIFTWAGAAAGVVLKVRGFDRAHGLGAGLYFLLGWLVVITLPGAVAHLSPRQLLLLGAVAALYSGGAVVLFTRRPDPVPHVFGYHEVWHAAVVAASACFFTLVWELAAHHI